MKVRYAVMAGLAAVAILWPVLASPSSEDDSLAELRQIGQRAARAVLTRDAVTLTRYSRPDLRGGERIALADPNDALYCLLFRVECPMLGQSVFAIISRARRLSIDATLLKGTPGPLHGILIFYDGSKMTEANLRSPDFLCEHAAELASWTFQRVHGRWQSANALFDFETDTLCPPSVHAQPSILDVEPALARLKPRATAQQPAHGFQE